MKTLSILLGLLIWATAIAQVGPTQSGGGGSTTNVITINNYYTIVTNSPQLPLSSPVWNDVRVPVSLLRAPGAKPDYGVWTNGLNATLFDSGGTESVYSELQTPHGMSTNNTYGIRFHLHWTGIGTPAWGSSNVVWGLEYTVANPGVVFPASTTVYTTNGLVSKGYHAIAHIVTITNVTESAVISMRLFREGGNSSDTYPTDAIGLSFDAHYPAINLGSTNEFGDY